MSALWRRSAALTVGKTKIGGKKYSGLRISFEIDKTSESTPNTSKVVIYNLSGDSRANLQEKGLIMLLDVGYLGLEPVALVGPPKQPILSQIFAGDVKRVSSVRQGPDIVTTLEAGDEEVKLRSSHIDMSFAPMTPVAKIVSTLASKLGVGLGTITPILGGGVFQNGLSLSGLVSDNLDVITKKHGLEWSVTDGELNILDPKTPTPDTAILITPETGLIGSASPRQVDDGKKGAFTGVEFTALLNPEIKPGRAISIDSDQITGVFRVRRVRYRGDTHAGDWVVAVEAVQ